MIVLFKDSFWLKKLDRYILLYGIIICFINVDKLLIIIIGINSNFKKGKINYM